MKRPTTVWNTLPAKPRSRWIGPCGFAHHLVRLPLPPTLVLLVAICGLIGLATDVLADDGSGPAYSTGKEGSQLEWLPYRPTVPKVDPHVRRTAHEEEPAPPVAQPKPTRAHRESTSTLPPISTVPTVAARPAEGRGPDSPFHDPFGDGDAASPPKAEMLAQQSDLLEPPASSPGGSLPPLEPDRIPQRGPVEIDAPGVSRGPVQIDQPGGLSPLPDERVLPPSMDPTAEADKPGTQSLRPPPEMAEEPLEPTPAEMPGSDATRIEAQKRGKPESELPEGLREAEDAVQQEADITLKCISPDDFRPVTEITTDITPRGQLPNECPLTDKVVDIEQARPWAPITYTWKAAGLCHKPLYFEQVHLERYGHSWGPYVQPFVSGAHFFLTVPVLPYKMGLKPPHECVYTLGYYRPGNCAPYMLDPIPLSVRAGLAQAGAWVGGIAVIP